MSEKKMVNKWAIACIVGTIIAVMYQTEVEKDLWTVSKSVRLNAKLDDAINFVTATDYMSKWFPFASHVREADGRPLGVGKKYHAIYDIPFYGETKALYKIVDYQTLAKAVVESEGLLRPRLEFSFHQLEKDESRMSVSISFRRHSYLFQYVLGPIIYFITNQRLQHSLFVLRSITPF